VRGEKCFVKGGRCIVWRSNVMRDIARLYGGHNGGQVSCPAMHYVKAQGYNRCIPHGRRHKDGMQEVVTCCIPTY